MSCIIIMVKSHRIYSYKNKLYLLWNPSRLGGNTLYHNCMISDCVEYGRWVCSVPTNKWTKHGHRKFHHCYLGYRLACVWTDRLVFVRIYCMYLSNYVFVHDVWCASCLNNNICRYAHTILRMSRLINLEALQHKMTRSLKYVSPILIHKLMLFTSVFILLSYPCKQIM